MKSSETDADRRNLDPLTGQPGSHPASTGAGAITGGLVGAAAGGLVGGPIGAAVGIGIGAIAGGLGGKAMARAIDETEEEDHWRRQHPTQSYAQGEDFEKFREAYRTGYLGAAQKYAHADRYEDIEADLEVEYGAHSAGLPWEKASPATKAAWERVRLRVSEAG